MCHQKAVIKNANALEEIQEDSVEYAIQALKKCNIQKNISAHMKKDFDNKSNST